MRKPAFCISENKDRISCAVTAKLISAFVFATGILQSPFFLNPKFQASSHLLWLYSPVCSGPGQKPRILVFSQRGSNTHLICSSENFRNSANVWHQYIFYYDSQSTFIYNLKEIIKSSLTVTFPFSFFLTNCF